jgi:C-terminal processing protease CtpA/Prc
MKVSRWFIKTAGTALVMGTALFASGVAHAQTDQTKFDAVGFLQRVQAGPADNKPLTAVLDRPTDLATSLNQVLVARFKDPADEMLGATLEPVGDTLRAQLAIPEGQGVLITSLKEDGACAQAGLKQNDILLSLADKAVGSVADLTKQLKAAGESAVPLKIMRKGKPATIQVRPVYRVTLGPVQEQKAEYFIGVSIDALDEAVRAQLAVPNGQGVVVTDTNPGSPAEKAGIKKHDVLLELSGKPIDSPQTLAREVQAAQDRPITLKLLRAGKHLEIPITASVRNVESTPEREAYRVWLLDREDRTGERLWMNALNSAAQPDQRRHVAAANGADDLRQRLDQVEKELRAVRAALDKISEALRTDKGTNRN